MMLTRVLRAALPAIITSTLGLQIAHADIYTWVDASGTINVSNLAPPAGVEVTRVIRASASVPAKRDEAAREAELQALAARVRQLEDEVELASHPAPPIVYRSIPPPATQYVVNLVQPAADYAAYAVPPAINGCDPAWMDCSRLGWIPGFYPPSVVIFGASGFRRFPPLRNGQRFAVRQPMRPPGEFRRG